MQGQAERSGGVPIRTDTLRVPVRSSPTQTSADPYTPNRAIPTIGGVVDDDDRTIDAKAVAEILDVHYRKVIREAENGKIPGRKVGASWRFSEQAIRAWLRREDDDDHAS
jgi:excisionase family DNA binding protein